VISGSMKSDSKKYCCLSILLVPIILGLIFFIITFTAFLFIRRNYLSWEADFEKGFNRVNLYDVSGIENNDVKLSVAQKIEKLEKSLEYNDFIELTVQEAGLILTEELSGSLPDGLAISATYIEPEEGNWVVYHKLVIIGKKSLRINIGWISYTIKKKDPSIDSMDISIKDFNWGKYNLDDLGLYSLSADINRGLNESLDLVIKGDLAGRVFENIELGKESVIIKGRLE